jgi:hypothetical protein
MEVFLNVMISLRERERERERERSRSFGLNPFLTKSKKFDTGVIYLSLYNAI